MIAVVDYGMGNLRSVEKALQKVGADVTVTASPAVIRKAQAIVLPGVGAFGEAMRRLNRGGLTAPLLDGIRGEKPFLGICLGLQLLFERSEESPRVKGLGVLKGRVVRFRFPASRPAKIPHMGWNTLRPSAPARDTYFRGIDRDAYFYFVHSYYPVPTDPSCWTATTRYGREFCSVVARQNLFATQFHPEKSGKQGLQLLQNFVRRATEC